MIKYIFNVFLLITFSAFQAAASGMIAVDSIGIETIDGKKFIVHKVEPKETLYALSRRYQVSVDDILTNNEEEKDGYAIDQIGRILYIPLSPDLEQVKVKEVTAEQKKHTVKAGETLYALSRKYEVTVGDLKKWNGLNSNQLELGQVLIIGEPKVKSKSGENSSPSTNQKENKAVKEEQLIHTVQSGETLYGITRKYNVSQSDIKKWNKLETNQLSIGQELIIKKQTTATTQAIQPELKEKRPNVYTAKKGETYADVAEQFDLMLSDVEEWNVFKEPFAGGEQIKLQPTTAQIKPTNTKSNTEKAKEGKIHIVKSGETIYSLSDDYGVPMEDLRKWNQLDSYQLSVGQKLYIKNPDAFNVKEEVKEELEEEKNTVDVVELVKDADDAPARNTKAYFTVEEDDVPKLEKVQEKGIAEVIEGSENTEKYLALHRTAKIGTIMQVRNDLNDQIVFVRVLGKLPNNGVDDKVIIKISKKAFEKLGGVDYKFPVEISYLPLDD